MTREEYEAFKGDAACLITELKRLKESASIHCAAYHNTCEGCPIRNGWCALDDIIAMDIPNPEDWC